MPGGAPPYRTPMGPPSMNSPSPSSAPAAARRSNGRMVVGIIAGAVILLLLICVGVGTLMSEVGRTAMSVTQSSANSQTLNPGGYDQSALEDLRARGYDPDTYLNDDGTVNNQKSYRFADSEGYAKYKELLESKINKYANKSPDDVIALLPELSRKGAEYYVAWNNYLLNAKDDMEAAGERTTTDPDEIKTYYNTQIASLNELEQKFLHGQDLGFHSTLRDAEGNVLDLYTGAFDLKSSQPNIPALTADWEKKIKAVPIQAGADGTYLASGEQLIAAVGLNVTYDYRSIYDHCTMTRLSEERTLGAFCTATPNLIYINQNSSNWGNDVTTTHYPNTIKHELAHAMIHRICGTLQPALRVDYEALTSSYAVLYFDADRSILNSNVQNAPWYEMTEASDTAAQLVHDGHCSISTD